VIGQYPKGIRMPLVIRDSSTEQPWWPEISSGNTVTRRAWDTSMDYELTVTDWYFPYTIAYVGHSAKQLLRFLQPWQTVDFKYRCNKCGGNGLEVPPDRESPVYNS
jgi:hypothetical protein